MLQNPVLIALILAFAAVVILAQTVLTVAMSKGDRNRQINRRLQMLHDGMTPQQAYSALVREQVAPLVAGVRFADLYARIELACRQAGLAASLTRLGFVTLAIAGVLWLVGIFLIGMRGGNILLEGPLSLVGAVMLALIGMWLWVGNRRAKRMKQFDQQMPLALDVVNRAIRAGHPVISAVQLAADELGDPVGTEFGLIVDETTYGAEFKDALANFARRTGSQDAHFFAVAVSIQSETGGNLAEILEGLTRVMRGRATLVQKVKALSSEGMASAYLLSALPVILIAVTLTANPRAYSDKFSDPIFWPSVTVILTLYVLGWLMIRRILNFKY